MTSPCVVVLGLSPTGLYVARELGRAGTRVIGIDRSRMAGGWSRYLSRYISAGADADLVEVLQALVDELQDDVVVIPTSDVFIDWLCLHYRSLPDSIQMASCYRDGVASLLLDKAQFYARCQSEGLPAPGAWSGSPEALAANLDTINYPCILKPALIHAVKDAMAGAKLFVVQDRRDLEKRLLSLPAGKTDWLLQELIPGPESNISLYGAYYGESGACQGFSCRKLRQYPPGFGSASLVLSEDIAHIRDASDHFLISVGFKGIAGTEFKLDPRDGIHKVIEINPRPTLWFGASSASGKRICEAAVAGFLGLAQPQEHAQLNNVVWRYWLKDLASLLYYKRLGHDAVLPPPEVATGHVRRRTGPVLQADDMMPVIGEALNYLSKLWHRL